MRLRQYWETVYRPQRLLGAREGTIGLYTNAITHWEAFGDPRPTTDTVNQFAAWLLAKREPATVNKVMRHLLAIMRHMERRGDLAKLPEYRRIREPRRSPLAFTVEEFSSVLSIASTLSGHVCYIQAAAWWRSLLLSIWYSGCRIGAMKQVARADVMPTQAGFWVRAGAQKDHEGDWYAVDADTVAAWRAAWMPARQLMWPWKGGEGRLNDTFRDMCEAAGVHCETGTGSLFHRIRKSTASYLEANGGNATAQLGHSARSVTMHYLDPRIVRNCDATRFMPRPVAI